MYIHVPFCTVRCGYCDFNTYTATELQGAKREDYAATAEREIALAATVLEALPQRAVSTVFFGGGTPTLLPAGDLIRMLNAVRSQLGIAAGAEITVEANPDTVTAESIAELTAAGVTRVSLGMQSAMPHVLATLDRSHNPENVVRAAQLVRAAGLELSLDLIYGTPGESLSDWRESLDTALSLEPDHVSAYALIVEDGTAMARKIARGEIAAPDDDLTADKYELADQLLAHAGFDWYELSNWAKRPASRSRHNRAYWLSHDWWGVGPGAHSHVGGVRWWNVKHPAAYAQRLNAGESPAAGREILDSQAQAMERMLLESRLREGAALTGVAPERVARLIADELIEPKAAFAGRAVLTLRGRLLADVVARELTL